MISLKDLGHMGGRRRKEWIPPQESLVQSLYGKGERGLRNMFGEKN